ncbi:MAG: hypothetical protein EBR30_03655 [Cytophagia bacterium]|jgi:hypothetical protein|nr:hypothetical protein [Cytophagia bacterium]NBW34108.1 hypothetical protein [Cytophagia bacterium]
MSQQNQTPQEPTRDEVIAWYKSQIELAQLRATLAEYQSKAVQEEARRLQALAVIAQLTPATEDENSDEKPNT